LAGSTALFGGTFNPIHMGHVRVAEEALKQFGLQQVVFLPTGRPPHKPVAEGVGGEDRYEMVRRAVEGRAGLTVSRYELDQPGPTYTVDTVRELKARYPEGIAYLVGADILVHIDKWKAGEQLIRSCPFIIAPRKGIGPEAFRGGAFSDAEFHFLCMEEIALSSREIRGYYREGASTDGLVPPLVDAFIRERGLYRMAGSHRVV